MLVCGKIQQNILEVSAGAVGKVATPCLKPAAFEIKHKPENKSFTFTTLNFKLMNIKALNHLRECGMII